MSDPVVLQSAVRVPTPPPGVSYSPQPSSVRKRSPPSRSPSPNRRRSPPGGRPRDTTDLPYVDSDRAKERERHLAERLQQRETRDAPRKPMTDEEKQAAAKAEYDKLLNMRSGGTYIPPARLRALQAQITDKSSKEYQRMAWEALKKSINGLINKVNVSNIKHIVPELFGENLIRGRGLFCRSIMKAQAASLPFTPIYAAMAAIVNTKLPQVGELLLGRLVVQFRKAFKRNDKAVCISSTTFIAHLCNQQVVHEMVAAQILLLLLHKPTDDSVEIAVGLTREVGQHLEEMSGPIALAVFDQFRNILHEADIDKRVQYMIEVLFQVRKDRFKDNPAIREELDLVEEEDQITHRVGLDDEIDTLDGLNIFKFDAEWQEHEDAYKKLKAEILGEGSDYESGDESDDSSEDEEAEAENQMEIQDQSNADLVNLRRTIYLTIMSSVDFEECCHKLMKISLPPGKEPELPSMIIECCSQERTYSKFYGLIGERFAKLNRLWSDLFEESFAKYYETIHRYETNRLRNIARFFGHILSNDAIGWHVLSLIHLNEEETTSSSRIFIKILFQDLAEHMGMAKLKEPLTGSSHWTTPATPDSPSTTLPALLAHTLAIRATLKPVHLDRTHGPVHRNLEVTAQPAGADLTPGPDLDHGHTPARRHIRGPALAVGLFLVHLSAMIGHAIHVEPIHLHAHVRALYHTLDHHPLLLAHAVDEQDQTQALYPAPHLPVAAVTEPRLDDALTAVPRHGLVLVLDRTLQLLRHEAAGVNFIDSVGYLHKHIGFFGSWCSVFLFTFSY
ncbi:pre-mRNA-splicing factor cwc22 [Talaromyces marneffei ATCC 18224]